MMERPQKHSAETSAQAKAANTHVAFDWLSVASAVGVLAYFTASIATAIVS